MKEENALIKILMCLNKESQGRDDRHRPPSGPIKLKMKDNINGLQKKKKFYVKFIYMLNNLINLIL